jgi:uncharacterized membrane protein YfcA
MRFPTVRFFLVLLLAPLCAMSAVSADHLSDFPSGYAGWLVTLCLWSVFAGRSARHLWQGRPPAPNGRRNFGAMPPIEMRLLAGITVFSFLTALGALLVMGLLLATLFPVDG